MTTPATTHNPTGVCASCRRPLAAYVHFVDIVPVGLPWEVHFRYAVCDPCAAEARRDEAGMDAMLTSVEAFFTGEEAAQ